MAVQVIPVRVGDVEVLATTVTVAGTEPTAGRAGKLAEHAGEAFSRAQDVIVGMAVTTAEIVGKTAARAARPDRVEVEFGIGFTAKGNIVVGGVSGEATLTVRLSYDAHRPVTEQPEAQAAVPGTGPLTTPDAAPEPSAVPEPGVTGEAAAG